jgi:response regulator of citrate/malate metabolism
VERTPGFEVAGVARTGQEALELAGSLDPDLVLLDVHLPDISGLEVLERLRRAGRHVPVLIVTAERGAPAVSAALHGGAMQYLVKPFEYDDLAERLRSVADSISRLAASTERGLEPATVDQATIDRVFRTERRGSPEPAALPKGFSPETADLVLEALHDHDEISASETAEALGLSRVTARRYLEHFVDIGQAQVRLQYGVTGRPERRYRGS